MSTLSRLEGGTLYPSYSSSEYELPAEWKITQKIVFGTFFTDDGNSSYIAAYDPLLNNGRSYYGHLENVTWVEEYPVTNLTLFSKPGFQDKVADLKFQPISSRELESGETINRFSSSPIEYDSANQKLYWVLGTERWSAELIADYSPSVEASAPAPEEESVSNVSPIDNVYAIQTTKVKPSIAISGSSDKSENVEGTEGNDLITGGLGKDKLIGGDGADQFLFFGEGTFTKKTVDSVIDFNASEGDTVVIADKVFGDLKGDPTLAIAYSKKDLKQLSRDGYDLLYFETNGHLYLDSNGDSRGFGKKSEGGIVANLPSNTILAEGDVLIGI